VEFLRRYFGLSRVRSLGSDARSEQKIFPFFRLMRSVNVFASREDMRATCLSLQALKFDPRVLVRERSCCCGDQKQKLRWKIERFLLKVVLPVLPPSSSLSWL